MTDKSQRGWVLAGLFLSWSCHASPVYTPAQMLDWTEKTFAEPTLYQLETSETSTRLRADCRDGQASALYIKQTIDLRETPILSWSWAISGVYANLDETSKAGDDYPVRVYVVKDGGLLPWRTLAVNYVWSSAQPKGSHWPNAFTANAQMLAVRSGEPSQTAALVNEQRNVRDDFKRLHDEDVQQIDGVALMTDCDNADQPATGWYGEIQWLPATSEPSHR